VRGEVRLHVFTEDPTAVTRYGPLETEDAAERFEIEALRPANKAFVARLRGVGDRDAAARLSNVRLYVPRERLPPTEDAETFYQADLVGLAVFDREGNAVGLLQAVHNFGAGDVLEIARAGGRDTLLLAFTQASVPVVDVEAGRIVIDPPAEAE
jgi:16S rRNA processing protein RimM